MKSARTMTQIPVYHYQHGYYRFWKLRFRTTRVFNMAWDLVQGV